MVRAACKAADSADAVDLNLGCPQRVAYGPLRLLPHEAEDRELVKEEACGRYGAALL